MEMIRKADRPARKNGFCRPPRKPLTRGNFIFIAIVQAGGARHHILSDKAGQSVNQRWCLRRSNLLLYYIRIYIRLLNEFAVKSRSIGCTTISTWTLYLTLMATPLLVRVTWTSPSF